jgi:hypothetical protein
MVNPTTEKGTLENIASNLLLPSQKFAYDRKSSKQVLRQYTSEINNVIVHYVDKSKSLDFIIYYHDKSMMKNVNKCVLFFNPNGAVVADYFSGHEWTRTTKSLIGAGFRNFMFMPAFLSQLENCPVIIPDYRGAGLGKRPITVSGIFTDYQIDFQADAWSMQEDAFKMIHTAASMFGSVSIWGSSIGGGASTVGLADFLSSYPDEAFRFQLTNHNSFKSTASVVTNVALGSYFISGLDANLKADKAMDTIIEMNVPVTVIAHLEDPIIPPSSRMVDHIEEKYGDALPSHVTVMTAECDDHMMIAPSIVNRLYERAFENIRIDPFKMELLAKRYKEGTSEFDSLKFCTLFALEHLIRIKKSR